MMTNYRYTSITEVSELIRQQKVSPVELVTECLERCTVSCVLKHAEEGNKHFARCPPLHVYDQSTYPVYPTTSLPP